LLTKPALCPAASPSAMWTLQGTAVCSVLGTKRTYRPRCATSAFRGKAENICSHGGFPPLTHSRLAPHAAFAADLVRRRVDVIVATGELPLRAAASATSTIPVVFTIPTGCQPRPTGRQHYRVHSYCHRAGIQAVRTFVRTASLREADITIQGRQVRL